MVKQITVKGFLSTTLLLVTITSVLAQGGKGQTLPRPDHVVIVIEENKSYSQIVWGSEAPYILSLAKQGALFTQSYAIVHSSQPNYLALFSGSTQGITDNSCPHALSGDNLGAKLFNAGLTFAIYSESMPKAGYEGCVYGTYVRKHNPAVNWQGVNIPSSANLPFDDFPKDYTKLPTVSIVVPNQAHDMHDGSIREGDRWLQNNLASYVEWAKTHNSLLIVTWDEDDGSGNNQIPTIIVGPIVKVGTYSERINHYNVLRTLEDMFGLPSSGSSTDVSPIKNVWRSKKS